jgi:TonB family protein
MKRLLIVYKRNIYGVIGTLLFHIFVVLVFILAEMDLKREMVEDSILIEFPVIPEEEQVQETPDPSEPLPAGVSALTNTPSAASRLPEQVNRRESFFDESYQQEIDQARRLVSEVNQQLSKEIPDLSKIRMPEQTTEGMDPDSISNVIFTGDSNIEYQLENRYHLRLPIPIYLARGGGTVTVDISVNRQGKVVSAVPRRSSSVTDEQIYYYAQAAAQRTVFNSDNRASNPQQGTIRYTFKAQ